MTVAAFELVACEACGDLRPRFAWSATPCACRDVVESVDFYAQAEAELPGAPPYQVYRRAVALTVAAGKWPQPYKAGLSAQQALEHANRYAARRARQEAL